MVQQKNAENQLEKITNKNVLIKMKTKMNFYCNIIICKQAFAGFILTRLSGKLILIVLESKIKGKKRGRPRRQ